MHSYQEVSLSHTGARGHLRRVGDIGASKMPRAYTVRTKVDRVLPRMADFVRYWKTIIRSGIIGVIVGAIPAWARTPQPGYPRRRQTLQQEP